MEDVKQILMSFFQSIKANVSENNESVVVKNISEKAQKIFGLLDSMEINFTNNGKGVFIDSNSDLYKKIKNYLRTNPSKTLLKIDFEFPSNIREKIPLRNCSIDKIEKKHENNYFSKFTILTTFRYLNKTEQVLNDLFVFEGKIIGGDLDDYNVQEGSVDEASTEHLAKDYDVAKEKLKELLQAKVQQISSSLNEDLDSECNRIEEHYGKLIKEAELNKSRLIERMDDARKDGDLDKVKKIEETLKSLEERGELQRIILEKDSVVKNEKMKYSLDVENKLVNTTVIYYPIFKIYLLLNEAGFTKRLEVVYDPLKDEVNEFVCDACKTSLDQINICHGGHICCSSCLHTCSECCKRFCRLCFAGVCKSCGKLVCKNCAKKCSDCGKLFCKSCMRTSDITGAEKCLSCISYCPICSKSVEKKRMVRGRSGQMVCRNCANK